MRFFKVTLAILLVIVITLSSVFYARSSVVTSLVNDYLTQYNSAISCIDFTVNADFDLVIAKLCIDSPYADLELLGILIEWQFEPSYLTVDKVVEAISAIKVTSVDVRAKAEIALTSSTTQSPTQLNELPKSIRQFMQDIADYTVPVAINIDTFSYQPFIVDSDIGADEARKSYKGKLSANTETISLSLTNPKQAQLLSLDLARTGADFTANISTDLTKLRQFLKLHQSALPSAVVAQLVNADNKGWSVKGAFSSQIDWHKQTLNMKNILSNLSVRTKQGFAQTGAMQLDATLAWQLSLVDEHLHIDFANDSAVKLIVDQQNLTGFLSAQVNDKQLKTLFADNAMNRVTIAPLGSIKIDFNQQSIISDGITLASSNLAQPVILSFNDIALNYTDEATLAINLHKTKFALVGQVKVGQLQSYSEKPVKLKLVGEIEQQSDVWQLKLGNKTAIEISQLSLPTNQLQQEESKAQAKSPANSQLRAKSLISHWQGTVAIAKSSSQSQGGNNSGVTFDLEINNQLKELNIAKVMQVNALELNSRLSGSIDNIAINTEVIVDHLPLASVKLTGDILHPELEVSANDILLTDLLALKLKPPVELQLIDGTLSYHISTQLKNNKDLIANPIKLTLSVQDVTGEIDGTWLQGLNWQQKFILQNGQLKSLVADVKGNTKAVPNLTIAKVETATPITGLSTRTLIDFSQGNITVVAKDIHGNLLGGYFDIVQVQWPFSKDSAMNVKLTEIDLEKLLELDKKQGIVVTGKVSGLLPIYYDGEHLLVKEGSLYNVSDGLIQVFNNPAVEELKASSTELKLAFSALENLHYHHLTSEVSMADDGYMLLVTEIKGRNPDLDNEVNLNLNLSYDLLGLLESFNITEHFESKVIKGLQKKN